MRFTLVILETDREKTSSESPHVDAGLLDKVDLLDCRMQ